MATTVLIIDDEEKLRKLLCRIVALEGYAVLEAATLADGRRQLQARRPDIVLCDVKLPDGNGVDFAAEVQATWPGVQIILITAFGTIADGVRATKNGALDYLVKGDDNDKIIPLLSQAAARRAAVADAPKTGSAGSKTFDSIVSKSEAVQKAVRLAQRVAPLDTPVLLTGETGTGKEVFAQSIHHASSRSSKPFVAINCSAFSRELLEGALFGHRAGAFTGAVKDRKGLIDEAAGGTLFLDEVGEMLPDLQPKLLRFLEDGSFYPLGETKQRKGDVRIIAATNRPLEEAIEQGRFRSDLYYRIAVFHIELPPLRERAEDIPALALRFVAEAAGRAGRNIAGISAEALDLLRRQPWKGNIRELKNIVERGIVLEDSSELTADSLPAAFRSGAGLNEYELATMERKHIEKVLAATGGNRAEAAQLLHIGIATLYRKLAEYGLKT